MSDKLFQHFLSLSSRVTKKLRIKDKHPGLSLGVTR
jgi:hypothetical protein